MSNKAKISNESLALYWIFVAEAIPPVKILAGWKKKILPKIVASCNKKRRRNKSCRWNLRLNILVAVGAGFYCL